MCRAHDECVLVFLGSRIRNLKKNDFYRSAFTECAFIVSLICFFFLSLVFIVVVVVVVAAADIVFFFIIFLSKMSASLWPYALTVHDITHNTMLPYLDSQLEHRVHRQKTKHTNYSILKADTNTLMSGSNSHPANMIEARDLDRKIRFRSMRCIWYLHILPFTDHFFLLSPRARAHLRGLSSIARSRTHTLCECASDYSFARFFYWWMFVGFFILLCWFFAVLLLLSKIQFDSWYYFTFSQLLLSLEILIVISSEIYRRLFHLMWMLVFFFVYVPFVIVFHVQNCGETNPK